MLKYIILLYSLCTIPLCFSMEQVTIANQAQEAREALLTTFDGLIRLKKIIDQHGIKETIDTLLIESFPEKISEFLAKYPLILETLKEARESRQENTSKKVRALTAITATPIDILYKSKEISSACLYTLLGGLLCYVIINNPSKLNIIPAIFIVMILIVLTKTCIAIKLPETPEEIGAIKIVNAGLRLMPALPALNKLLKITEKSIDYTVNTTALDAYKRFLDSLTSSQKSHIKNYKLIQAAVDPEVLIDEMQFLKVLDNEQMRDLYTYIKHSGISESIHFSTFKGMLRAEQQVISNPENRYRYLFAQFNPLVFLHDNAFTSQLDSKQLQYLLNLKLGTAEELASTTPSS